MTKKIYFFLFLLIFSASALLISQYAKATDAVDPKPVVNLSTPQVNNLVTTLSGNYTVNCGDLNESWCRTTNGSSKGLGAVEITWNDGSLTCDSLPATHTYQVDGIYRIKVRVKNTCGYIGEAYYDLNTTETTNKVSSITLSGSANKINWTLVGTSSQGFKIVWSKNTGPTYPTRSGDQYHYFTDMNTRADTLDAFDGTGKYYVRVCEYLDGVCGVYSNEISLDLNTGNNYSAVSAIELKDEIGDGKNLTWKVTGYSAQGYKVVWSKNSGPTYPTRSGDQYHYFSDPNKLSDSIDAFNGNGVYYARVCEYLSDKCGTYSNEITVGLTNPGDINNVSCKSIGTKSEGWYFNDTGKLYKYDNCGEVKNCSIQCLKYEPVCGTDGKTYSCGEAEAICNNVKVDYIGECKTVTKENEITVINDNAKLLAENKMDEILAQLNELRNLVKEQQVEIKYLKSLTGDLSRLVDSMETAIKDFVAYGVDSNTKALGEGERAAVIYSYKSAYGELPTTEANLADVIKIANGRWPSEKSIAQEDKAKVEFQKIYGRLPNLNNVNDNAAVTVMTYGLRQKAENRKLASEQKGMVIFKKIYGHNPSSTAEWNILQAITYSGAKR